MLLVHYRVPSMTRVGSGHQDSASSYRPRGKIMRGSTDARKGKFLYRCETVFLVSLPLGIKSGQNDTHVTFRSRMAEPAHFGSEVVKVALCFSCCPSKKVTKEEDVRGAFQESLRVAKDEPQGYFSDFELRFARSKKKGTISVVRFHQSLARFFIF